MLTLFLGGDTMTGRGIDQILPRPVDPALYERFVDDARDYVQLAARRNGPVAAPVEPAWIWGEALDEIARHRANVRIVNLETAVTRAAHPWPGKEVHYRMSPENAAALEPAQLDVCVLANNHVLDWGRPGLDETLAVLHRLGIATVGAGAGLEAASAPVTVEPRGALRGPARGEPEGRRAIVVAACTDDCGVPADWAATSTRSGVALLPSLEHTCAEERAACADALAARATAGRRPGDAAVVSLHWGGNWGHHIPEAHVHFAHRLIEAGVDVVHGHSSHHPRAVERHGRGIILYGCGELIDDYEGIDGFEPYRSDLVLLYFVTMPAFPEPPGLRMTPMRIRHLRLERANDDERALLRDELAAASRRFGSMVELLPDGDLRLA
jgi:poly-gamma-glutamate capsule biosynthesis protein CapA/YwtB (metallophosphatase superfamily)